MVSTIAEQSTTPVVQGRADKVISVQGLMKVFKDFWGRPKAKAVNNVDFEIKRGEVFGLLGPNGSGKSTTIKMLLGLLYPTRGHIEVFGHSPRHVATKSRIGYLPEESYLYRYLDSQETLDFFGNLFLSVHREKPKELAQVSINNAFDGCESAWDMAVHRLGMWMVGISALGKDNLLAIHKKMKEGCQDRVKEHFPSSNLVVFNEMEVSRLTYSGLLTQLDEGKSPNSELTSCFDKGANGIQEKNFTQLAEGGPVGKRVLTQADIPTCVAGLGVLVSIARC